jgi:hypothetical protein
MGEVHSVSASRSTQQLNLAWASPWYPNDPCAPEGARTREGPFQSAEEHYAYLMDQADGGTEHTMATIPNWSGLFETDGGNAGEIALVAIGIDRDGLATRLTPEGQELYQWDRDRWSDGTAIDPLSFCLGATFPRWFSEYGYRTQLTSPDMTLMTSEMDNQIRYVFTDGRPHPSERNLINTRMGYSIGHWDGDILNILTVGLQEGILQRNHTRTSPMVQTVERWRYIEETGNFEMEITIYDPVIFQEPYYVSHKYVQYDLDTPEEVELNWPQYWSCPEGSNWYYDIETGYITELTPSEKPPLMDPDFWYSAENKLLTSADQLQTTDALVTEDVGADLLQLLQQQL